MIANAERLAAFTVGVVITATTLGSVWILKNVSRKPLENRSNEWDELISFWFEGPGALMWFLKDEDRDAADRLITSRYANLLVQCERGEKDWWAEKHLKGALGLIIVLDQFSRHIWRGDENRIHRCGAKARMILEKALERGEHEKIRGDELTFFLMPFRHEKPVQVQRLEKILDIVDARERKALHEKAVLSRFKRVTESRLSDARAELEKQGVQARRNYSDSDILEPYPVIPRDLLLRLTEGNRGPVYKTIERYLTRHMGEENHMIVSLSGGVDSMVLITIIHHLITNTDKFKHKRVVAAHVDYGNRGESHAEAEFVDKYSASLGIQCVVHQIEGLLRGVTDRDEYEEKSRQIRFDLYKRVWQQTLGLSCAPIVLFGHHEGDVVENVLSNSMKGKTILELSGMTEESLINGCIIRRPLLPLTKDHIFDYSHRFQVPYFKDTTPRWSTRGQVRLEVLPCLERVYGKGFQNHLARLAEQSDDAYALLSKDFFADRVVSSSSLKEDSNRNLPVAFAFDMSEDTKSKPLFLWRLALRKAAHDHGILIATDKAVKFLYDSLGTRQKSTGKTKTDGWFAELRRGSRGYVWENRYLLVFRYEPDVMVPYESLGAEDPSKLVVMEDSSSIRFGLWNVSIASFKADEEERELIITMNDIWTRFVEEPSIASRTLEYTIMASPNSTYILSSSHQVIPSLKVDMQLRTALIPQVFAQERPALGEKIHRRVKVVLELCV